MRKHDLNVYVFQNFKTETDVAQNLIYDFFPNFDCQSLSATGYSGLVIKNNQIFRSRYLVHEFSFTNIF